MADEEKEKHFSDVADNVLRLKRATWKLRAEALRRYRMRHRGSLDRAEQEMEKQQNKPPGQQRVSRSPSENGTPDIKEEAESSVLAAIDKGTEARPSDKDDKKMILVTSRPSSKDLKVGRQSVGARLSDSASSKSSDNDLGIVGLAVSLENGRKSKEKCSPTSAEIRSLNGQRSPGFSKNLSNMGQKAVEKEKSEVRGRGRMSQSPAGSVVSSHHESSSGDSVFDEKLNFEDNYLIPESPSISINITARMSVTEETLPYDESQMSSTSSIVEPADQMPIVGEEEEELEDGKSADIPLEQSVEPHETGGSVSSKESESDGENKGGKSHLSGNKLLEGLENGHVDEENEEMEPLENGSRRHVNSLETRSEDSRSRRSDNKLSDGSDNGDADEENEEPKQRVGDEEIDDKLSSHCENSPAGTYVVSSRLESGMKPDDENRSSQFGDQEGDRSSVVSNVEVDNSEVASDNEGENMDDSDRKMSETDRSHSGMTHNICEEEEGDMEVEEDDDVELDLENNVDDVDAGSQMSELESGGEDVEVEDQESPDADDTEQAGRLTGEEADDQQQLDADDTEQAGRLTGEEAGDQPQLEEEMEEGAGGGEVETMGTGNEQIADAENVDKEKTEGDRVEIPLVTTDERPTSLSPTTTVARHLKDADEETSGSEDDDEDAERKRQKWKPKPADGMSPFTRGDEDEIMSEQKFDDDETEKIPDDFYYNYEDHVSKAAVSDESGLPLDLLTLYHSFGYESLKRSNLHIIDKDTVVFAAGNIVQIVNVKTLNHIYIRSTSGGGIGAVAVHPSRKLLAIAEKGTQPNINVYEYPSLRLYRILRGGTERSYSYIDFSPDGKLLASVGGDPDYMLTLWDWKQEKIVLRSKAFSQDVFRITFSTELEGQLTSSGVGHIRFWKMASTFTGLKLQGQLGKFGKKEISDIEGYVELPDGKVLSGSESGNMLLWDGGLIKVEIGRKNKKPCHQGPIQQIIMDEGELMTIGVDGYIRVWDFETVDNADTADEVECFEMEPMNELRVGNDVQLRCMVKSCDPEEATIWYAQDANGCIWRLDLSFSFTSTPPEKLLSYHSGAITGCDASPITSLVATIGVDFTVRVFDYLTKSSLCMARFNTPGACVLWVPKIVDPKGSSILTGFEDGVVRVLNVQKVDGIDQHGRKLTDKSEIVLKQALKPHKSRVTSMAIDSRGEILATGSTDCTVFFLSIGENYEPIGFVKTPSAVTHLDWSPASFKRNTLLVCCAEGQVLEIESPDLDNQDASHTYEIEGLHIRTHQFKSVKSNIRHEEEMARKFREEEEQRRLEAEERQKQIDRGMEPEADKEELEEEEGKKEEPWEPYIPEKPSSILGGFHAKDEGKFWLSMGDYDAGYLYECEFLDEEEKAKLQRDQLHEPTRVIPVHNSDDIPIRSMHFSNKHLFLGMDNGSVRIQPLHGDDPGLMGPYWSLAVHDNQYGSVTQIVTSHDNTHLFSVGHDGNFFVFAMMDLKRLEQQMTDARASIPSAKKEITELRIDDISDTKAYSIEDAKQKAEYDKMLMMAEEKKSSVHDAIQMLRDQFQKLVARNAEVPSHLAINRKEFEMDPEIKKELMNQKNAKIEVVKKEMAWEEARHQLAFDKLHSKFKDAVDCELIIVKSFSNTHEVSSFRLARLSDSFYRAKAEMDLKRNALMEGLSRQSTKMSELGAGQDASQLEADDREGNSVKPVTTSVRGNAGERIIKALAKVDEKKKKRAARQEQWDKLLSGKPDPEYEDPEELAAIKDAEEHMGDYKLKSAHDYVVPDHLRMNTEKARHKLLVLKEQIYNAKHSFNDRLTTLRDKKIRVISEISDLVFEVERLQTMLGPALSKSVPAIPRVFPCEVPERKYDYTNETLIQFREMKTRKEQAAAQAPTSAFGSPGFSAFAGMPQANTTVDSHMPLPGSGKRTGTSPAPEREFSFVPEYSDLARSTELNELEMKIKRAEEIRLIYQRDHLLEQINKLLNNFDVELRCLRHDRFKLDIDMKNADLRQMVLFEELILLKEFEKTENVLMAKLQDKFNEKLVMDKQITEANGKLEQKKKDIDNLVAKENQQWVAFKESIGDSKFTEYLTKVYRKKIRRSKKKATDGQGDEDSDSDSDEDSDESESEEESDEEVGGLDLDVCPPGCDQTLYDNTCLQREKRLDIEEQITEERKNRETLAKELENMQKKAKVIEVATKAAEQELEAFQLEKQRKLNELDVIVTLRLHQIEYVVNGTLPNDLSHCLVFEAPGVVGLQHRIQELEHERLVQKREKREAKRQHVQLVKDRRLFDQRITKLQDECNKLMIEKFGCIVDIEKLETVTVNRQLEEVKDRLSIVETENAADHLQWEARVRECKDQMTEQIRINTERLEQLTTLLRERKQYEKDLDLRQKNQGAEFGGVRQSEIEERQRLIQLVQLQAQEIDALKDEILMLSRKGGHVMPPSQPPLPRVGSHGSGQRTLPKI